MGYLIMKVVIPVSYHDRILIDDFCNVVEFFGPYNKHELLVVCRPSDIKFGLQVFDRLCAIFSNPRIYMFEDDGPYGWPQGPNYYWKQTIEYLIKNKNELPWLWMELDCTPVKDNWLDLIQQEYVSVGSKCLGMMQKISTLNGEEEHLVGVAIYPADFGSIFESWKTMNDNSLAFDVHCQTEIVPVSANSNIMSHHFRTSDYDCTDAGISGKVKDSYNVKYNFDRPISDASVMVHGCQDGSLARIITNT